MDRLPVLPSLYNNADDVSKRSVERLYFPKEPSHLRHFVKKPAKRSPLTNRCYWIRLRAIDAIVRQFLERPSAGKKVVVDVGCGSDVLPWRCNARYPEACKDALFIDLHDQDALLEKRKSILETPQLRDLLGSDFIVPNPEDGVEMLLESPKYWQFAPRSPFANGDWKKDDMFQIDSFWKYLELKLSQKSGQPEVLFIAEATLMYLGKFPADHLLYSIQSQKPKSIGKVEFCALEQILPHGPEHFFAKSLLNQWGDDDPRRSYVKGGYPSVSSQKARFTSSAWQNIRIWDLWEVWEDDNFVTKDERQALDQVESFDEWEDLILWCRHLCLVHASTDDETLFTETRDKGALENYPEYFPIKSHQHTPTTPIKRRRFGGAAIVDDHRGHRFGTHIFGKNADKCLDNYDHYAIGSRASFTGPNKLPLHGPSPRTHFTLTDLGEYGHLLVGGRQASLKPCSDCWVLRNGTKPSWERVEDLPVAVSRHSAVRIRRTSFVLLTGGKTGSGKVLQDFLVFHPKKGWLKCKEDSSDRSKRQPPTFGASLVAYNLKEPGRAGTSCGVLFGGLLQDGTFSHEFVGWTLSMTADEPVISFQPVPWGPRLARLSVFGALAVEKDGNAIICGGVGASTSVLGDALTWLPLGTRGDSPDINYQVIELVPQKKSCQCRFPLMIGHSVVLDEDAFTIFGGGVSCFPLANMWQTTTYGFSFSSPDLPVTRKVSFTPFEYKETPKILPQMNRVAVPQVSGPVSGSRTSTKTVPRVRLHFEDDFEDLLREGMPVIIEGLDVGSCVQQWTLSSMAEKVGPEQEVVAHECKDTERMDFNSKNFQYITDTFANILKSIEAGGRLYLRSLSNEKPSQAPANIEEDFPDLAEDFKIPEELKFVKENLFSSILRLSGRVNMWLHYDVMANIYTQIRGSKRMILFPPSDVSHLSFAPGASSSSLDVFAALDTPALAQTRPHEAQLNPGDILLLPPMWFHTATPTSDMSIAVNVFFRDLEDGYSSGRDVYGNRDLAAYEKARQDAAKIGKSFQKLPTEIRKFYLARIADELRGMSEDGGTLPLR